MTSTPALASGGAGSRPRKSWALSGLVVEVPELPGCMADGQTYAEAVANAEVVIDEWIETARKLGRSIPEPRGKLAYA